MALSTHICTISFLIKRQVLSTRITNHFFPIASNHWSQEGVQHCPEVIIVNGVFGEIVRRTPTIFSIGYKIRDQCLGLCTSCGVKLK